MFDISLCYAMSNLLDRRSDVDQRDVVVAFIGHGTEAISQPAEVVGVVDYDACTEIEPFPHPCESHLVCPLPLSTGMP